MHLLCIEREDAIVLGRKQFELLDEIEVLVVEVCIDG